MTGLLQQDTLRFVQNENVRLKGENDELREEVARLREVLDALRSLQEITTSIDAGTDVLALLDRILAAALKSIGASDGSLILVDDDTRELVFVVVHGEVRPTLLNHRIPWGSGIVGWVAANAKPVIAPNVRADARFSSAVDKAFQFKTQSMMSVPLIAGGLVMGVLNALNKIGGKSFSDGDLALLSVIAQLAAIAMRRAEEVAPA